MLADHMLQAHSARVRCSRGKGTQTGPELSNQLLTLPPEGVHTSATLARMWLSMVASRDELACAAELASEGGAAGGLPPAQCKQVSNLQIWGWGADCVAFDHRAGLRG